MSKLIQTIHGTAAFLAAALLAGMLCACGSGGAGQTTAAGTTGAAGTTSAAETTDAAGTKGAAETAGAPASERPLQIVACMFPEYDWVREILGGNPGGAELTLLMDSGADLHSYQPTAEDMMRIASCDIFIYTGGLSSQWAEDALKGAVNPDMIVLDLMDLLGDRAKEETFVEGMQDGGDHASEEQDHEDHGHDGEEELDEHIWLSLRNASFLCGEIGAALGKADPANRDQYAANTAAYQKKLDALERKYREAADSAKTRTLLFGDRFPFLYLTEDYGLSYYAAFSGCSSETEASFETIAFLAAKADEIPVSCILTIDGGGRRIAETIVRSTKNQDQKILTLNSMQSVAGKQIGEGVTYLSIMEENLSVLREALGC
ncbi:MAG: zinc ABC transporter substrate-binding protein [Stomatobaculum sp.]|nr:zinc ABC transporter substrate-binding protein [Stomatobaculum sp.]